MLSVQPIILAAALTATGNVEMLEFTASWCGPCQTMKGTVNQIRTLGYTVHTIDFDRQRDLVQRYQVTQVPTYIVVSEGRELDRVVGAVPGPRLIGMLDRQRTSRPPAANPTGTPTAAAPGPQHTQPVAATAPARRRPARVQQAALPAAQRPAARPAATAPQQSAGDLEQFALRASVRLRVDDKSGHSFGTGTIVDVHGEDALVLTCGHIFRDSDGRGQITVDLFAPGAEKTVAGELIRYDLDTDLALVGIKSKARLVPVRIAGPSHQMQPGHPVFSIGCNRGQDPTVMRGRINAVNKYLGPENLTASGQPIDGRSGGGLFTPDGYLVGVCNAADPESNEGLYAAYRAIHRELDQSGLSFVYQPRPQIDPAAQGGGGVTAQPASFAASAPRHAQPPVQGVAGAGQVAVPFAGNSAAMAAARRNSGSQRNAEVICIIRSRNNPTAGDQLIVLDRPSRDFMSQLQREDEVHRNRRFTELRVSPRRLSDRTAPPRPAHR